jgi:hypothetical protein
MIGKVILLPDTRGDPLCSCPRVECPNLPIHKDPYLVTPDPLVSISRD